MGKQSRSKKSENNVGKGKVTPMQVAFIVDRYLADNNFTETRSVFRNEASSVLAKTAIHEAPKSLLTLGDMLDEYIRLKEQKIILDQEKCQLEREKCRVQNLLQGMQDLMTSYSSASGCLTPPPPVPPHPSSMPQLMAGKSVVSSSAAAYPVYRNSMMTSSSMPHNKRIGPTSFSTSTLNIGPPRKRRCYKSVPDANQISKKPHGPPSNNQLPGTKAVSHSENVATIQDSLQECTVAQPLPSSSGPEILPSQGTSVAMNLSNQPSQSPTSNSSGPKTPSREASSQSDKFNSPHEETSSTTKFMHTCTPEDTTPANCTIISSKTVIVSPNKCFSIERNHCTFSSPVKTNLNRQGKRDHVKGRLDFDSADVPTSSENVVGDVGTSTSSESEKDGNVFELELPNFDVFGPDFCLSDLLSDFGIECEGLDYSCEATVGASVDAVPGPSCEPKDDNLGANKEIVDHSSSMSGLGKENGK